MSLNTGEILCGMITLSLVLCILKLPPESQSDSSRNVIISTKRCQVQMALSCPTTIPVEFSTLEISSGTAIPYYWSIKRSKLPACATKPPFDRASGLLLMVAIKALGGVFLRGLTSRLQTAPTLPAGCQDQPAHMQPHRLRTAHSLFTGTTTRGAWEQDTTVYSRISNFFTHLSSLWDCRRHVIRAWRAETLGEKLSAACRRGHWMNV